MASSNRRDDGLVEFSEYLQVLRRRRVLILLLIVIGLAGGFAYGKYRGKSYTASATVQVRPATVDIVSGGFDNSSVSIATQQSVLTSSPVAEGVRTQLHSPLTADDLRANTKVAAPGKANTLTLEYTASNPQDAAKYANAFVTVYLRLREQQAQAALNAVVQREQSKVDLLDKKLTAAQATLQKATPNTSQYAAATANQNLLLQQLNALQAKLDDLNTLVVNPGALIIQAMPPTTPAGLSKTIIIAAGGLIGLLIGLVLAFIRDRRDDRIRRAGDVPRLVRAPVLGSVPRRRGDARQPAFPTRHPTTRLTLGALVARLAPLAEREQVRTLLVASPNSADGAEATGIDIALALADAGMRVALVTPDPARLQPEWLPADGRLRVSDVAALRSGGDLLNPERVRRLLAEAREYADFVVVVGPPVLRSADSLVLAERADGVVLVIEKRLHGSDVQRASAAVAEVGGQLLGVVLRGFGRPVSGSGAAPRLNPAEEVTRQTRPVPSSTSS